MCAILIIEYTTDKSLWPKELRDIDNNINQFVGATKLVSGSWLIELETGLQTFGILLRSLLSQPDLRYEIAFLEKEPVFVSPSMKLLPKSE